MPDMPKFQTCTIAAIAGLLFLSAMPPAPVHACGWWGDGEMNRDDNIVLTTPDGKPVPETLDINSAKLPGRMGYGIAVTESGRAVPYLQATYGRQLNRISELKVFGFQAVIDLGTAAKTANLHQTETESVGMSYFNIPIKGDMPTAGQARLFSRKVMEFHHGSLLVYAPTAPLLGMIWASHRIYHGAPLEFAVREGKSLGMTDEQIAVLRKRARTD